ncbi:MAG: hypothetical protein QNK23_02340 [Crocinitomicaceae bacterium]|nr:hypothetical protein [Crocinitomicaceae bacterium]
MPVVKETKLNIIGYRAISLPNDSAIKTIFEKGFPRKKDPVTDDEAEQLYYRKGEGKAGDMFPGTAVCCTTKLNVASLFPLDTTESTTYIFMVYVDQGFDTYTQQQLDAWDELEKGDYMQFEVEEIRREITWPLYAEEFASLEIPAKHVIACVKCDRNWKSKKWQDGGAYRLDGKMFLNERTLNLPISTLRADKALTKLRGVLQKYNTGSLPKTVQQ